MSDARDPETEQKLPIPTGKTIHLASRIYAQGAVRALCHRGYRLINLSVASWTHREEAVTCAKCLADMARRKRQRGSVVISLMLLGAIAGICTGWLALVGSDFPPPLRPYPVAAGNDPDPPPRRSDWKLQRRCMREYRRTKRPTN